MVFWPTWHTFLCLHWPPYAGKFWFSEGPVASTIALAGVYVTTQPDYYLHLQRRQHCCGCLVSASPWLFSQRNASTGACSTVLTIMADQSILDRIKARYLEDEFCKCMATTSMKGWQMINGLWYIGERLLIPQVTDIRKSLFKIAHDSLGHFGADKLYTSLRNAYCWPNMRRDLEHVYIPLCADCLRNKSPTMRPVSPLHPLPVPDQCGVFVRNTSPTQPEPRTTESRSSIKRIPTGTLHPPMLGFWQR